MNSDFLFVVLQHQFFINVIERLFVCHKRDSCSGI